MLYPMTKSEATPVCRCGWCWYSATEASVRGWRSLIAGIAFLCAGGRRAYGVRVLQILKDAAVSVARGREFQRTTCAHGARRHCKPRQRKHTSPVLRSLCFAARAPLHLMARAASAAETAAQAAAGHLGCFSLLASMAVHLSAMKPLASSTAARQRG